MLSQSIKSFRNALNGWMRSQTLPHLQAIREHELATVLDLMPKGGALLEIGAGTGWQAEILAAKGYRVSAIDLATSEYHTERVWPVVDYDGHEIPFADNTFDIVFSSNVLEHIPHVVAFQDEIHRVLKPGGIAIHVLPSGAWRWWSNLTFTFKRWIPAKTHGEIAQNPWSEIYYFSGHWWTNLFSKTGWLIEQHTHNNLFYSGTSILDSRLSIPARQRLSPLLGSACHIFVLRESREAVL